MHQCVSHSKTLNSIYGGTKEFNGVAYPLKKIYSIVCFYESSKTIYRQNISPWQDRQATTCCTFGCIS